MEWITKVTYRVKDVVVEEDTVKDVVDIINSLYYKVLIKGR